ncbi:MAG: InlB B-repeat-containing protein [Clostridiales bacterium]|nr:InlB B-repeat-containing protein [Clostridiales bacterium]
MKLLRSAGMPWKKNARRAISAVLAMAMAISAAGILKAPKLKASGEHQITISAATYSQGGFFIEEKLGATGPVDIAGGTVELTKYTAEAGEIISVLANPKTTFQVEFVLVGNGVTGTDISKLDAMEFEMPDEDVMVDVKFKAIQDYDYTVYFDTLDGYGSMPARIFPDETSASAFTLPAPTFDCPDNKIFAGWVIPEDETVYGIGAAIPVPKEGLVCFAKYIDFNTKAIFTAGDHGTGTMDPITFTSRAEAAAWRLPECGFDAEDGYCFDCWDVLGTEFKSGDPFSMDLQVEYFAFEAKWKPLENSCYVVAAGALNVREDASIDSDRVGGLTYGKAFDATSEKIVDGQKWVRLKYNGDDGVIDAYVMRKYLYLTNSVDTAIEPQKVTVTAGALNVRSTPEALSDMSNRISGVTAGDELLVTGYMDNATPDDTSDDWLVLDYEMPDGTHRLAFVMSKYTEGIAAKLDVGTKSLKISGSIPTGYSLDPSAVVASDDTADISAENFGNEENGLYTAIIYPADGHNFSELQKSDITLAEGFDLSIMDLALNDDGSISLTFGPVAPVKISFVGSDAAELLAKYISEGKTVVKPAEDPTLEGSTFTGWYEDEACTIEFDFSKPITGDITIFAGFQPNEPKSTEAQQQGGENTITNTDTDEPQSQVTYTATCDDGKVIRGSGKPFVVTVKRSVDDAELCFQSFRNAYIDGKPLVKGQNYTAEKGSTIITIKSEALDALADGTHTITIEFADGKAEYTFTLAQPDAQTNANTNAQTTTTPAANSARPKTGDVGSNTRIVAIIAVALVGIAAVLLMDKRKKDEDE